MLPNIMIMPLTILPMAMGASDESYGGNGWGDPYGQPGRNPTGAMDELYKGKGRTLREAREGWPMGGQGETQWGARGRTLMVDQGGTL